MSNYVQQIITNVKSEAATTLGSSYQELQFVYDVEKNNYRGAYLGYGVRPLEANTADGVVGAYTLDHGFELILTSNVARTDSDAEREDVLEVLYNKADEIFKALVNSKLGLASFVLNVFDPSISEPEFYDDSKFVVLRMQFIIKYRSNL